MKKYFNALLVTLLAFVSIEGVNAAHIDTTACETVYTNYYFFLDANTTDFFNQAALSDIKHSTIAEYHNNSYLTTDFDKDNIGYGRVDLNSNTSTSRDGIDSMSLSDYYDYYLKATRTNGAFTEGNKNFIVFHDWYSIATDGTTHKRTDGLDVSGHSKKDLMRATLDARADFTVLSPISSRRENPFQIRVDRKYRGYLTGEPVRIGQLDWYLHPAVFYIQYCEPLNEEDDNYRIEYDGNANNVSNVPKDQIVEGSECDYISNKIPTRDGYRFLGWSLKSNASSADANYAPGSMYCGDKGDITLYAVWERIEENIETYYTIFYKSNTTDAVSGIPADYTANINNNAYIANNTPVRNSYTFLGWSTDSSATTPDASFAPGTLYTDRKDLVLYAVWKANNTNPGLPDNPQTGITDYLLPFGSVISASGLGLGILKKKKSFRQF